MKQNNKWKYQGDSRYEKVYEKMQLLGIQDITTDRQQKNGTIVWKLPIKNKWNNGKLIEVASFSTGYVRNQNSGYSNYQLNKRYFEDEYFKDYDWVDGKQKWNGKYRKFNSKKCTLIPIEIDRLEYLISYCLKNYFIKRANEVADGKFVPEWYHNNKLEQANETYSENTGAMARIEDLEEKLDAMTEDRDLHVDTIIKLEERLSNAISPTKYQCAINKLHDKHNKAYNDGYAAAEVDYKGMIDNLSVTVNGHRYKVI